VITASPALADPAEVDGEEDAEDEGDGDLEPEGEDDPDGEADPDGAGVGLALQPARSAAIITAQTVNVTNFLISYPLSALIQIS